MLPILSSFMGHSLVGARDDGETVSRNYLAVKNLDSKIDDVYALDMGQQSDVIDRMIIAWQRELPELDPSALGLVGRVIVLAQHLERSVNAALAKHKLA